jgi:hypothetical protein
MYDAVSELRRNKLKFTIKIMLIGDSKAILNFYIQVGIFHLSMCYVKDLPY